MSGGGGQSPGGSSYGDGQEMNIIYISVGLVALIGFLGWLFYADIVKVIFYIKLHELKLVTFFDRNQNLQSVLNWGMQIPYKDVKLEDLIDLSKVVGNFVVYPFMAIGVIFAIILYFRHPDNSFKTLETMETLADKMRPVFPAINVVKDYDLVNQSIHEGPWAMALSPIEYCQKHKLLFRDDEGKVKVDEIRAKSLLVKQLGQPWQGIDKLLPHQRAIFAVLATYVNYQRKVADKMMEQLAHSADASTLKSGKLDYTGIENLIKQYANSPKVKEITSNHAYVLTVFSEMLSVARKTGIVANSLYLWVKPIDRSLWYTLNNVGRQAVFAETGAVRAHWLAEKELGYAVKSPMVDSVLPGLQAAIDLRIIRSLT